MIFRNTALLRNILWSVPLLWIAVSSLFLIASSSPWLYENYVILIFFALLLYAFVFEFWTKKRGRGKDQTVTNADMLPLPETLTITYNIAYSKAIILGSVFYFAAFWAVFLIYVEYSRELIPFYTLVTGFIIYVVLKHVKRLKHPKVIELSNEAIFNKNNVRLSWNDITEINIDPFCIEIKFCRHERMYWALVPLEDVQNADFEQLNGYLHKHGPLAKISYFISLKNKLL